MNKKEAEKVIAKESMEIGTLAAWDAYEVLERSLGASHCDPIKISVDMVKGKALSLTFIIDKPSNNSLFKTITIKAELNRFNTKRGTQ